MIRASVFAFALLAAACTPPTADKSDEPTPEPVAAAPQTREEATAQDTCGAAQYSAMIGTSIAAASFPATPNIRVIMPGSTDGLGLAHTVCKRWPAIKTIIASGQRRLIKRGLPKDSRFFLKPYDPQIMISEIRSLLGPQTEIGSAERSFSNVQKRAVLLRLVGENGA